MVLDSSDSSEPSADIDVESSLYGVAEYADEIFTHLRVAEVSLGDC